MNHFQGQNFQQQQYYPQQQVQNFHQAPQNFQQTQQFSYVPQPQAQEVVPIHAMPPAMRQAVLAQQGQNHVPPMRTIPGQNQPFVIQGLQQQQQSQYQFTGGNGNGGRQIISVPQQISGSGKMDELLRKFTFTPPVRSPPSTTPQNVHITQSPSPLPQQQLPQLQQFYNPEESVVFSDNGISGQSISEPRATVHSSTVEEPLPDQVKKTKEGDLAIGIDLGTTYSVVGVFRDGKVEIISNEHGNRTTPSCVAFPAGPAGSGGSDFEDRLVGESAQSQAASNPKRTVFDAKRLIGRKFSDKEVQDDMKHWPFQVVENEKSGNAYIRIGESEPNWEEKWEDIVSNVTYAGVKLNACTNCGDMDRNYCECAKEDWIEDQKEEFRSKNGTSRDFAPEEISAIVLQKLKQTAERYLNQPVTRAVITCPAYFNDSQRQATIDAAKIAGLEVLRIINEPTAASIAYGLNTKSTKPERNILVFDLGGGTMDVSYLNLAHGVFTVKATGGNCHLGGCDFDNNLVKYALEKWSPTAPSGPVGKKLSDKALRRLLTACEKAKRTLSSAQSTTIEVDALHDGEDLRVEITRAQFEMLNSHLFDACLETVRDVLRDGGIERSQIDDVVFVGGSSRIPRLQEMITAFFQGKKPNVSINPDECVGYGAAIQASILAGHHGNLGDQVLLVDVAPLSLGVETAGGAMSVLIPRNTTIPCLKTNMFSTYRDNQESVLVSIFEGERALCADNNLLGNFYLNGLQPAKAGVPKIQVTFELDVNGVLHVSAEDQATQNQSHVSIKSETGRLSKERIEELVAEAARHQDADQKKMEQIEARNGFERFLFQLKQTLVSQEVLEKVPLDQRNQIDTMVNQQLEWLNNPHGAEASVGMATKEQIDNQKRQIEEILAPILGKLYATTGELPGQADALLQPGATLEGIDKNSAPSAISPADTVPILQTPVIGNFNVTNLGPPYKVAAPRESTVSIMGPPPAVETNISRTTLS